MTCGLPSGIVVVVLSAPLPKGRGITRVPRKILDFSGCLKGEGLVDNLYVPAKGTSQRMGRARYYSTPR